MRTTRIGILGGMAVIAGLSGCGGGKQFANKPRPAAPVNLTVYINNSRVSVSPDSIGAGPLVFIVTNQASRAVSLEVQNAPGGSGSQALADTGPINPQATATVKVNLKPGDYIVATGDSSQTAESGGASIQPAQLHLGQPRPSGKDLLLQP
jgi:hypothetical protein